MSVTREDLAADVDAKYHPEKYRDIDRAALPGRPRPTPPPPQLFDIEADPMERNDLAAAQQERVARMTNRLACWFEEVEADRCTIQDN